MNLYELSNVYVELLTRLEECQTLQEQSEVISAIDAVNEDIGDKGEAYARIIRIKKAESVAYEAEIKRLTALKKRSDDAVSGLKESLMNAMLIVGATEINTSIGKWKIQKNPLKVIVHDAMKVPSEFVLPQPPKVLKKSILLHFNETGEHPEGCEVVQSEGVRFR